MKLRLYIGGLIAFSVLFSSCGKDSEEGESFEPHTYNVSGKVEKGSFVSEILYRLNKVYLKVLLISFVISIPVSYYFMER